MPRLVAFFTFKTTLETCDLGVALIIDHDERKDYVLMPHWSSYCVSHDIMTFGVTCIYLGRFICIFGLIDHFDRVY